MSSSGPHVTSSTGQLAAAPTRTDLTAASCASSFVILAFRHVCSALFAGAFVEVASPAFIFTSLFFICLVGVLFGGRGIQVCALFWPRGPNRAFCSRLRLRLFTGLLFFIKGHTGQT